MNKNYINYSDLPEEIQFEDEFKDIFYKMEYSQGEYVCYRKSWFWQNYSFRIFSY